jgi:hypothetical protein
VHREHRLDPPVISKPLSIHIHSKALRPRYRRHGTARHGTSLCAEVTIHFDLLCWHLDEACAVPNAIWTQVLIPKACHSVAGSRPHFDVWVKSTQRSAIDTSIYFDSNPHSQEMHVTVQGPAAGFSERPAHGSSADGADWATD